MTSVKPKAISRQQDLVLKWIKEATDAELNALRVPGSPLARHQAACRGVGDCGAPYPPLARPVTYPSAVVELTAALRERLVNVVLGRASG